MTKRQIRSAARRYVDGIETVAEIASDFEVSERTLFRMLRRVKAPKRFAWIAEATSIERDLTSSGEHA